MIVVLLTLLAGTGALILGAELLVRGASRLAAAAGISSLVVGLTVVSFGTSAPELAVTVGSVLTGRSDVGVGNVVGSNILNIFLILGISAALRPLVVSHRLVRREVPILIGVTLGVWYLAADGSLGRVEGIGLFLTAFAYSGFLIHAGRRSARSRATGHRPTREEPAAAVGPETEEDPEDDVSPLRNAGLVLLGLLLLLVGARWLVDSAVTIATALGVSQVIIGLTVVALGTSLPEVATSALAAVRGERDIAVGNVVGSNVFNLTLILGSGSAFVSGGLDVAASVLAFDVPIMAAATVACLPVFFTGYRIARWEGWLFVGYYLSYTLYLVLAASSHDALDEFSVVMAYFVVPLTVITLVLLAVRAWRAPDPPAGAS